MKTSRFIIMLPAFVLAAAITTDFSRAQPAASLIPASNSGQPTLQKGTYQVTERNANSQVWQRVDYETLPSGKAIPHVHRYTELATGLNFRDLTTGQWTPSKEEIDTYSQGAIARQGQYRVIFANDLKSAGAIDMQTPDGNRLRSSILGLAYYDSSTGSNVLVAQTQDSQGELISSNQALYPDAFEGVKADVRYTYKKGSFEQDVILREQPPAPESCGLNSQTTEIEVLTEFIDPPQASIVEHPVKNNALPDEDIGWGAMRIGHGKAFDLGEAPNARSHISVRRQYVIVQDRNILIEGVPMERIKSQLASLPLQSSSKTKLPAMASKVLTLPKTPLAQAKPKPMKLASSTTSNKGYVLDYVELNTDTNDFTFQEVLWSANENLKKVIHRESASARDGFGALAFVRLYV